MVKAEEYNGQRGGKFVKLTYTFQISYGDKRDVITNTTQRQADEILGHEDELTVLYNPNDASINTLYPLQMAKIADHKSQAETLDGIIRRE